VDDHPDAEAEHSKHCRSEHGRTDNTQIADETTDRLRVATAKDERREQAEHDQAAEPDDRGEDVQEQQPICELRDH
jgi:hypothetical protein